MTLPLPAVAVSPVGRSGAGTGVGVGVGGTNGPAAGELRQPLHALALFRARTPTTYVFALSTPIAMVVDAWSRDARSQVPLPLTV